MKEIISLLRSKLKKEILKKLNEKELTPVMVAKILKKPRPSISRTMTEMSEEKFIECINPKADRWRFYTITKKGKNALKKIEEYESNSS